MRSKTILRLHGQTAPNLEVLRQENEQACEILKVQALEHLGRRGLEMVWKLGGSEFAPLHASTRDDFLAVATNREELAMSIHQECIQVFESKVFACLGAHHGGSKRTFRVPPALFAHVEMPQMEGSRYVASKLRQRSIMAHVAYGHLRPRVVAHTLLRDASHGSRIEKEFPYVQALLPIAEDYVGDDPYYGLELRIRITGPRFGWEINVGHELGHKSCIATFE